MLAPWRICLLSSLVLSACSEAAPNRGLLARVDSAPTGSLSAPLRAAGAGGALAILTLPSEARVRGPLSERRYIDGWRQSVALDRLEAAEGWNELTIDIRTDGPMSGDGAIPMGKPTQDGIRREILARFPATEMRIVTRPMQNALGPFGVAIGAGAGGMRCVFAWQWLDDLRFAKAREGDAGATLMRGKELPASIRLRLCRTGVTADQLAGWFERLELTDLANVQRVVEAVRDRRETVTAESRAAGRNLGEFGAPGAGDLLGPPLSLESAISGSAPVKASRRKGPSLTGPRTAPLRDQTAAAPGSMEGPRYLAPVEATAGLVGSSRLVGAAARLDPTLPPQAYGGPSAER